MADDSTNLENFNEILSYQLQLLEENRELRLKLQNILIYLDKCNAELKQLRKDYDLLNKDHKQLLINYSSLLKTARDEVERKIDGIASCNSNSPPAYIHSGTEKLFPHILQDQTNMAKGIERSKSHNKDLKKSGSADICDQKLIKQGLKDVKEQLMERHEPFSSNEDTESTSKLTAESFSTKDQTDAPLDRYEHANDNPTEPLKRSEPPSAKHRRYDHKQPSSMSNRPQMEQEYARRPQMEQENDGPDPEPKPVTHKVFEEMAVERRSSNRQTYQREQELDKQKPGPAEHKIHNEEEEPETKRRRLDSKPSEGDHEKEVQKAVPRLIFQSPYELIMENIDADTQDKVADATGLEDPRLTSKRYMQIVQLSTVTGRNVYLEVLAPYSTDLYESKDSSEKFEEYEEDSVKNFDDGTNCSDTLESCESNDGDVYSGHLIDVTTKSAETDPIADAQIAEAQTVVDNAEIAGSQPVVPGATETDNAQIAATKTITMEPQISLLIEVNVQNALTKATPKVIPETTKLSPESTKVHEQAKVDNTPIPVKAPMISSNFTRDASEATPQLTDSSANLTVQSNDCSASLHSVNAIPTSMQSTIFDSVAAYASVV